MNTACWELCERTGLPNQFRGENRVLLRWRASLWKLIWRELAAYVVVFMIISTIYRFNLDEEDRKRFEQLATWCNKQYSGVPLTFLLGFYVSLVVKRWWEQYCLLPWPDSLSLLLGGLIQGDNRATAIKKTVLRYCMLSYILCLRRLSDQLRKRLPTIQDIVKCGLMRPDEAIRIGCEANVSGYGSRWWAPLQWSVFLLQRTQAEGIISSPPGYARLLTQICSFRSSLHEVESYAHLPIPLVYTQVVTLAVYVYFVMCLVGDQHIIPRGELPTLAMWFPLITSLKFLFYFGWLKVAESLYNPFGDDDQDFEINELVDRHLATLLGITELQQDQHPEQHQHSEQQQHPKQQQQHQCHVEKQRCLLTSDSWCSSADLPC